MTWTLYIPSRVASFSTIKLIDNNSLMADLFFGLSGFSMISPSTFFSIISTASNWAGFERCPKLLPNKTCRKAVSVWLKHDSDKPWLYLDAHIQPEEQGPQVERHEGYFSPFANRIARGKTYDFRPSSGLLVSTYQDN